MDTVLIADHDLGFVFWLGRTLGEAGYQALPAKRISDAAQLAAQFEVDVLVVNPALEGAADFIRSLRVSQGHLKAIIQIGPQTPELEDESDSVQKPLSIDDLETRRWLTIIQSALAAPAESRITDDKLAGHFSVSN